MLSNLAEHAEARPRAGVWVAAAVLLAAAGACFLAILPPAPAAVLIAVFVWSVLPGVIIARRLYGSDRAGRLASLLIAPVWGFSLTSIVLLALWIGGVRNPVLLSLAPLGAMLAAIPCGRLAAALTPPSLDRRDLLPLLVVLMLVPIVDGLPYARVGEMRPEGKAYRAYFIADFEWRMTVATEVAKGDVPPQNPFLAGDALHYYWLPDLLSAIEYRTARGVLSVDQVLLANALLLDFGFLLFLYLFVRQFVRSPGAAAVACVAAVLLSSFEGAQQLYVFWKQHIPLQAMRSLNIDAISNWKFGSLKVDGLQRLLLYQPHHATAWAVSLSGLLALVQARDNGRFGVNLLAGTLLAIGLLLSSFIALMVAACVGLYQLITLAGEGRWKAIVVAGIAGGIPAALAVLATNALQYVDATGQKLVYVGNLNPLARTNTTAGIVLSFGPLLIAAAAGGAIAVSRRARALAVPGLIIAVAFFFYFFVDVIDHQHAYVGFRSGHLLFMAFAPLVGFAWQELSTANPRARLAAAIVAVLLALGAAPMIAVDLYNSQDTNNHTEGPGFRWTEIITPDELEALEWIKKHTQPRDLVQVDPLHDAGTWAYMPAFGERRMVAGMPISMIPLKKYQDASDRVAVFFKQTEAAKAYAEASALKLQYIYIGPSERRKYPQLPQALDAAPYWFRPLFHNASVTVYRVT